MAVFVAGFLCGAGLVGAIWTFVAVRRDRWEHDYYVRVRGGRD